MIDGSCELSRLYLVGQSTRVVQLAHIELLGLEFTVHELVTTAGFVAWSALKEHLLVVSRLSPWTAFGCVCYRRYGFVTNYLDCWLWLLLPLPDKLNGGSPTACSSNRVIRHLHVRTGFVLLHNVDSLGREAVVIHLQDMAVGGWGSPDSTICSSLADVLATHASARDGTLSSLVRHLVHFGREAQIVSYRLQVTYGIVVLPRFRVEDVRVSVDHGLGWLGGVAFAC